jgi:hypothetical protein
MKSHAPLLWADHLLDRAPEWPLNAQECRSDLRLQPQTGAHPTRCGRSSKGQDWRMIAGWPSVALAS